jgi:pimeloyl-ACP methyl ester carboxylesterase
MIEPRSSFVDADNIRLHFLEWDPGQVRELHPHTEQQTSLQESDEIPLVMLHGLGASADTWRLVANYIYPHRLIVAFDARGHGLSDQPENGYDLVTVAEDIVQGMAELGLGKVALVGHGWGARIALVLTARHPALISHLVPVDCPHIEPRHWPGMTRERFIREAAPKEVYASRASFIEAMRREMATFWTPEVESIILASVRELPDGRMEERLRPENQRRFREALWDDRALSYYSKLRCPVLLIPAASHPDKELPERMEHAAEFAIAKGYMASQVARTIPRCSVLWMPETNHDIQLQRPQLLATAIEEFVKSI